MRSILSILSLLFVLLAGMSAQAGPLEDGLDAYRLGEWDKAFAVLQPLAQAGNPAAQEKIGRLYQRGKGVERDYALAAQWYRRAADQGESQAQTRLAMMLRYGIGPRHDYAEAMKWYRAGAALGNKLAQVGLGYMLMEGVGVPVDYKAAAEWFEKAAAQALHVPYRGSAPGMIDTIAGRHAFQVDTLGSSKGFIDAGKLRVLAVAADKRIAPLPDVPR